MKQSMYIYSVHEYIPQLNHQGLLWYKLSSLHADEEETDQAVYRHNNVCSVPTIIPQLNHQELLWQRLSSLYCPDEEETEQVIY